MWLVKTSYGEVIAIEDVERLYRAVARSLVERAGTLGGKEIRFLRKHPGPSPDGRIWSGAAGDRPVRFRKLRRGHHDAGVDTDGRQGRVAVALSVA